MLAGAAQLVEVPEHGVAAIVALNVGVILDGDDLRELTEHVNAELSRALSRVVQSIVIARYRTMRANQNLSESQWIGGDVRKRDV